MKQTFFSAVLAVSCASMVMGMASKRETPPAKGGKGKVEIVAAGRNMGGLDKSLRNEVNAAIDRSLDWLVANQKPDGSWSNGNFPALTAFAVKTLVGGPKQPDRQKALDKGVKYILSCVRKDGGIYKDVQGRKGGGLSNYNTAICMSALHTTGRKSLVPVILDARKFIADAQYTGGDVYKGGFGYDKDTNRAYTDLLNTYHAVRAMSETADVEDLRPKSEKRVDINWNETVKYITRMQNKQDTGEENEGGFFYKPGQSKAGTTTNTSGKVVFRSYGSMTYAGLLALIHADVSRDDVRVKSAFDWSAKHWSLEENPGMGDQGLYFFYNVLTRALTAYGQDVIPVKGKDKDMINWRKQVAERLVSLQKIDPDTGHGYWKNDTARFWEADPVLATGYSLLALQLL